MNDPLICSVCGEALDSGYDSFTITSGDHVDTIAHDACRAARDRREGAEQFLLAQAQFRRRLYSGLVAAVLDEIHTNGLPDPGYDVPDVEALLDAALERMKQ